MERTGHCAVLTKPTNEQLVAVNNPFPLNVRLPDVRSDWGRKFEKPGVKSFGTSMLRRSTAKVCGFSHDRANLHVVPRHFSRTTLTSGFSSA